MEVPPGVFESDSRAPTAIVTVSVILSLTFVAVALRTYTRFCVLKQVGIDDISAIFTFLLVFGCAFASVWNVRNGLGRHVYFLRPEQIKEYFKTLYTSIVLYNAALGGIKMTFLLQYYRVLGVQKMRKYFIGSMVIIGAWSVSQLFLIIFNCTPVATFWDKTIPGTCLPNNPGWYFSATGNIITDLMIFVLPLPVIVRLKLHRRQKYVLLGIFSLGFFTCAISVIRIHFLQLDQDFTYGNVATACWSVGELCCGLACACLPACRPLVSRFIPALSIRSTKPSAYHSHVSHPKKTGNTSQQRDPELGGGSVNRSRRLTLNQNRYTEVEDSEAEVYGMDTYNTSDEGGLPIQVPVERRNSTGVRMPPPVLRQDSVKNGGYKFHHDAAVETRIEATRGNPEDGVRLQSKKSIEITVISEDAVQASSQKVEVRGFT
ncbi:hypothetical protein LZ30DRAFT_155076 [Colletotrichum cereale]|nr:hypothetical protein LZ30DRAFT_155076 [Colletotrichum cereale]